MTTTTNDINNFDRNLLIVFLIVLLGYFLSSSCQQNHKGLGLITPSEQAKTDSLRVDFLKKAQKQKTPTSDSASMFKE